jgi:hypothetical protein
MNFETSMKIEDAIREAVKARFPSLDPDWAVKCHMDKMYKNSMKKAEILILMMPEIIRSQRRVKGSVV